ncbi:MAG: DUF2207 domain-containing protein [Bacteroidales bacterium]|nr:DUF2207 domain-containing protein [Bacteroidales bacterium]
MRNIFLSLALACALLGIGFSVSAQQIRDIETLVSLYKDGSAVIDQTWDVTVTEGTEWYIPVDNLGKSYIHDFHVYENDQEYANDGRKWNSDRTLEQKTGRCGIVEKKGGNIELCWGQGPYGDHVYRIVYTIDNLVQAFDDCDGFHWHFLNDEWRVKPEHVSINILNYTTSDVWYWNSEEDHNIQYWAYGMIGQSWMEDGALFFESSQRFDYDSFFSALVRFDKGLFSPAVEADGTFEELKDAAMEGSDYEEDKMTFFDWVCVVILLLVILGLPLLFIGYVLYTLGRKIWRRVTGRRYDKKIFGKDKIIDWYRDVPMDGNPTAFFSLLQSGDLLAKSKFDNFPNLVSAYFLKWIQDGLISVEKDLTKDERTNLRFAKTPDEVDFEDVMERKLFGAAFEASGENRLLEQNEFRNWSYMHDERVSTWPGEAIQRGRPVWQALSEEERCHAVEFKNFLSDFTLIGERAAPEVAVWEKYLVLAASLGIADKVAKEFERLFPKAMEEYVQKTHMTDTRTTYYVLNSLNTSSAAMMSSALSHQAQRSAARAEATRRSFGGGGSISRGGGGGGFGGGHGGGSR